MNQEQYAKANAAIERLAMHYPRSFFLLGRNRCPLKIGIFDDLVATGVMESDELHQALRLYCQSYGYRMAMRAGAARLNLTGAADGAVTAKDAATPEELEKRRAKYRARKEEAERKAAEEAHKRYTDAWAIIDKLEELYPLAFFVKDKRRPLKLDVLKDIVDATATVLVGADVENALRLYTGSNKYLKGLQEGVERIDLAGEPTGLSVTAEEAAAAVAYRARIKRRRQEREAANLGAPARACTTEQPIPQTAAAPPIPEMVQPIPETVQPKRQLSGLADLKAAALARRNMENANV
jgi:sRNA-binding protein